MLQDEQRCVGRRKQFSVYAKFPVLDSCRTRARRSFSRSVLGHKAGGGSGSHGHRGDKTSGAPSCAHGRPAARALALAACEGRIDAPTAGSTSGSSKYPTHCICRVATSRSTASCPTFPRDTSATSSVAPLHTGSAPSPAARNGIACTPGTNSYRVGRKQWMTPVRPCKGAILPPPARIDCWGCALQCRLAFTCFFLQQRCTRRFRRAMMYRAQDARSSPRDARSRASRALQRWQSTPATQCRTVEGN